MRRGFIFSHLATFLALPCSHAAPAQVSRAESISRSCINTVLRQSWLVGECLTGVDETTRINSAVYLGNKIQNKNATLVFQGGTGYDGSCQDCKLADAATLTCLCRPAYSGGEWDMSPKWTSVKLDEHISVYNGHLLSNMNGTPKVPSQPSKWPVPLDLRYRFGGNVTCPGADGPGTDFCGSQGYSCTSSTDRKDTSNAGWGFTGPIKCYVPKIYFPQYHYQFTEFKLAGEGAWQMLGYDNEECEGGPIVMVRPEDSFMCRKFDKPVKAVTIVPAFNGDPN